MSRHHRPYPTYHAIVMARGEGRRLYPLTHTINKPALPFAGLYRIVDFVLHHLQNMDVSCSILTPAEAPVLHQHLQHWSNVQNHPQDIHIGPIGNAASVHEALNNLDSHFDTIGIYACDQVFDLQIEQVLDTHRQNDYDLSIFATWVPAHQAHQFGIIYKENGHIHFLEKPSVLPSSCIQNGYCLANMGIYWFKRHILQEILTLDATDSDSDHDFGHNILPKFLELTSKVQLTILRPELWQDVGSIQAYWDTTWTFLSRNSLSKHMMSRQILPATISEQMVSNSPIPQSCIIQNSIIHEDVYIGEHCHIQNAIIGSYCRIEDGTILSPESIVHDEFRHQQLILIPSHHRVYSLRDEQQRIIIQCEPL